MKTAVPVRPRRWRLPSIGLLAATALLGACSGTSDTTGETTTASQNTVPASLTTLAPTAPPVESTSAPVEPTTSSDRSALGCRSGSTAIPTGATRRPIVDVDGDGRRDLAWIATAADGSVRVGVVTATGGGTSRSFVSASPVARSVLVVDANRRSPVEFLASTGRSVQLWVFENCAIVDVKNAQGRPYEFSLGFSAIGTGVGCVDVNGQQQLVGLDAKETDGVVAWSRTVVTLSGHQARNGAITRGTFTSPGDYERIVLLHRVTCGTKTMTADGLLGHA